MLSLDSKSKRTVALTAKLGMMHPECVYLLDRWQRRSEFVWADPNGEGREHANDEEELQNPAIQQYSEEVTTNTSWS